MQAYELTEIKKATGLTKGCFVLGLCIQGIENKDGTFRLPRGAAAKKVLSSEQRTYNAAVARLNPEVKKIEVIFKKALRAKLRGECFKGPLIPEPAINHAAVITTPETTKASAAWKYKLTVNQQTLIPAVYHFSTLKKARLRATEELKRINRASSWDLKQEGGVYRNNTAKLMHPVEGIEMASVTLGVA